MSALFLLTYLLFVLVWANIYFMEKFIYQGKFIQVSEEKIEDKIFERTYLPNGVIIFPITKDGKVLLIEEKRPHENPTTRLKFVSGHLEENEEVLETANRELQEEIGYKAGNLELIYHHTSTGTVNNHLYFVEAKNLSESKLPNPDGEDTILSIKPYSFEDIVRHIYQERLKVAFPCFGLLKLLKSHGYTL